jgi:DNA-binding CsgD family transcriptional regulator
MSSLLRNKNHLSLVSAKEVKEICEPLFRELKLNNFFFSRFYKSADYQKVRFSLTVNPRSLLEAEKNIGGVNSQVVFTLPDVTFFHYQIETLKNESIKRIYEKQARRQRLLFNDGAELWLHKRYESHIDTFEFIAHKDDHSGMNRLLNNLELFNHFINYFYEKADSLIRQGEDQAVIYPEHPANSMSAAISEEPEFSLHNTVKSLPIRTVWHRHPSGEIISLNKKDLDFARLLTSGVTSKQISVEIQKSPRTVESRIDKLKKKLGCSSKSDLCVTLNQLFKYHGSLRQ